MDRALKLCIQQAQVRAYAEEMKVLTSSKTVPAKSDLKLLTPFKDEDGLLRVGGRLGLAPFENLLPFFYFVLRINGLL